MKLTEGRFGPSGGLNAKNVHTVLKGTSQPLHLHPSSTAQLCAHQEVTSLLHDDESPCLTGWWREEVFVYVASLEDCLMYSRTV